MNKKLVATALLAVLSMSLVPLLIRSTQANETTIGLVRLAIAITLLLPLVLKDSQWQNVTKQQWGLLVVVGTIFGAHWFTYFVSIKMAGAAIGALSISTYGIHLLFLNWAIKKYPISLSEWVAVLACFMGCVLIAPELDLRNEVTTGMLIGILSGFLYACLPLLHQKIAQVPTMVRAWGQFAFAMIFFAPLIPFSDWQLDIGDWWRLVVLGIVCTVIGHTLWVKASTELPPVITGVTYYLYIPIAITGSYFFLNEPISFAMLCGAILIIVANMSIAILAWRRTRLLRG